MTEQVQFRRICSVQIGGVLVEGPALRVAFRVRKSITKTTDPNQAEVKIYNLAQATRQKLDEAATEKRADGSLIGMSLAAGYAGADGATTSIPQIFRGEVRLISSRREGTEWVTTVQAVTGAGMGGNIISSSLAPGSTKAQRLTAVLDDLKRNNPLVDFSQAFDRVKRGDFKGAADSLKGGASLFGKSLDYTKKLAQDFGLEVWVDDDAVYITGADEVPKGSLAVLISPETGMLEAPNRIFDQKNPKAWIVRVKTLLNGGLVLGRQVQVNSESLSGMFRVRALNHEGDTHGQEWSTEIEASLLARVLFSDGSTEAVPITPQASQRVQP